jgi:hypothetical protein
LIARGDRRERRAVIARRSTHWRSMMRRHEDLLGRAADADLAPEHLETLDMERPQVLAHELGRHVAGREALLLVLEDRHHHGRVVARLDDLEVHETRLIGEPVGVLRVCQVHYVVR